MDEVVKLFEGEIENNQEERNKSAFASLSKILLQNQSIEGKYETLMERILEHETKNENDPFLNEKFKRYLKLLHGLKMYEKLVEKATMMYNRFQSDIYPLEWICKVYAEKLIEEERMQALVDTPYCTYFDAAVRLNPESALALVARGILYHRVGELKQAEAMLSKVDTIQPNWDICLTELAEIYCCQKAYGLAENIYRRMNIVNGNLFVSLIEDGDQDKLREALSISDNVLKGSNSSEMLFYDTKLKLLLGHMENHDEQFEKLKTANISEAKLDYLNALRLIGEGKRIEAQEILQKHEDNCECLLELANIYYNNSNVEQSFVSSLRATKLEPSNAKCFYWLGKLYVRNSDTARARKCLEKCVSLNPSHKEAIILLSSLYRTLSEWEANHMLLQNTVSLVGGNGSAWAQLQLGLHHLGQQSYDDAIAAFRTVIRYDVDNITSWEGLADAYMGRGSFTSAMKVFEKTAELKPDNPYPKLQLANIKNVGKKVKSINGFVSKYSIIFRF